MAIAISPNHTDVFVKDGWTLDKKIEVFTSRVRGWHLGVAKEMIDKEVSHRHFAVLMIVMSYFEMIGKYRAGYCAMDKSRKHFKLGIKHIFPNAAGVPGVPGVPEELLDNLYAKVRNGLYHIGMAGTGVLLTELIQVPFQLFIDGNAINIHPNLLVIELLEDLERYHSELKDASNTLLRENFEKRFNFDNGIPAIATTAP